jgi:hypothetical protein
MDDRFDPPGKQKTIDLTILLPPPHNSREREKEEEELVIFPRNQRSGSFSSKNQNAKKSNSF